ncbi:Gfo/Idh/MocA family oxidoreductase [Marivirga sp. S37H4]|uniref:Gfo/Idh/MocA family oxidoreductase n=1 Tax=Marivirga aurantiaca TaxID=2802615 RepID=A0A934X0R7_9BACT|nr:Gfo/Idh/MocA family oxidoreductase [Marivirga aurantiaca]MBK6266295.1 Gfo/Idh/MocA family oxidoreductase [Marivirga aurantiaca]
MNTLKMGIIGGGPGSMIGDIHKITATPSGKAQLVCGAFSSDPKKSQEKGKSLGLDQNRIYDSFQDMIYKESKLPQAERMDFVAITTPNYLHAEVSKLALEAGFHVMCDKPLSFDLEEAIDLQKVVRKAKGIFAMTYTYRGYPLLKKAADLVASQHLGNIRKVRVNYSQGWLSNMIEADGHKQALWRTDPTKSGNGGTIADIGTHAFNLLESVTGLRVSRLCADVSTLVKGRQLDDDTNIILEMENGAKGVLSVSQICTGEDNDLSLQIYGDKAGLVWDNSQPNELNLKYPDFTTDSIKSIEKEGESMTEVNIPGHSPYFTEGFQNIYEAFFKAIENHDKPLTHSFMLPGIEDGVRGMLFIEKAIESSNKKVWIELQN